MLVLIVISYINLAYPACGIIPEDLGQHTDLKTPVPWYPVSPRHISYHCKFPCERIPEAVQKHKKRIWSNNFLKRPYEWCYKQPCHPSMHFIRYPAVEAFAKHDVYIRVCNRIAQPREHPPVVCYYITVMQGNNIRLCIGDDISIGYPRGTPLSVFSGPYIIPLQCCRYLTFFNSATIPLIASPSNSVTSAGSTSAMGLCLVNSMSSDSTLSTPGFPSRCNVIIKSF